jgi:SAM-dependent methyltransferase
VSEGFESRAEQWLAWARTPGHDAYWHYREPFFALLPPPGGRVLEVGCGEGRVTRDLTARGYAIPDERDGLTMTWDGMRHPLHAYASALEAAGLAVEALREPAPADDAPPHYEPWRRIPMFLMWRAGRAGEAPPAGGASVGR